MEPAIAADFQTLSQIAITIMGFTGIIGALQSRGGKGLTGPEVALVATLLVVTAFAVFACFIPGTVALICPEDTAMWKWSFRVLLVAHLVAWAIGIPFMLRSGFLLEQLPEPQRTVTRLFAVLGLSAVVVEAIVVTGNFIVYSAFLYQCILILMVSIAFMSFVFLMFGLNE
ncbi:MAG: hypothetical protein ACU84Q_21790 [Gammaproteobacteria bacterium]